MIHVLLGAIVYIVLHYLGVPGWVIALFFFLWVVNLANERFK